MWAALNTATSQLQTLGTALLEQTEQMAKELADMPDDEARARYQEDLARAAVMEQSGTASRNEAAASRNESLPTDKQPPAGAQWEEQQLLPSASPHTTAPSHTESPSTTARPVVQVLQDATPVSTTHGSSTVQQKKQQHAEPASPSANAQHALEQRNAELTRMLEIIKQKAKSKIQELSTTVQTLTEENRQLKEYSSAVELQGAGAEELAKIQALTSENESLRVQLVASSMLQQTVDDVQEQLSQREATIAQLQSQMEATASANANERAQLEEAIAEAVDAAVADKDAELERLRHDYEQRLLASQATAEEELRVMREQVAAKTSAMDTGFVDDVGEENSQDNSIATLQSQLATVTAERDELQRQAVVASRVPELEKALDDNRRLLAGSKTIVDKLKAEVIRLRALAADGGSPRPPLSPGASDEVASLRQQLQRKDAELHQKATQLTAFKESLEAAEQARAELQQQVAESHRDTSATELQNQLDVANESLNQALADVSSLEEKNSALQMQITDANAGQHLKQELDAAQSALTTATERASTAERTAAELQSQLDDLQEQLNQREQQLIAQVSSSTDSDAHQKRIAELESELSTVASQLEAERERSTSAETSVVEKQEMIAALERQIAGLHKATMLVRTKDQELQVMRESLTTVEQRLAAATQSAADMEVAKVEGDAATAMLQRKVDDLHLRIEAQRQASDEEIARVRAYTQELEEKLVQAESIAVQASSNESELKAHVAEAEQLRAELASANDRLAAFDAAQQSHSETSQLARDLEEQNRVRALRMEKLSAELDSVRAELHAKVETMEAQRLEFDRLKEENATMASDVEGRVGEANQLLQERTHEARALQTELQSIKAELTQAQNARQALEASQANTARMLNEAGVKLNQTKAELDAERQRSARAAALENKATTYEQQVVALQQQLASTQQSLQTMSSRAATQSGPSREDMDRVQQEWLDKYRLLEQDNLRLRDRTMRVEGMLDEMQQQRAAAANAARPGQLRPVDSALMAGVATLPWLAEKQDDEDFDMGRGRGGMMQEDGNAALRLKFMARRLVRRVAREVDVQSVRLGYYFRDTPVARLALATYVAIVHVVFLYMLLTDGGGTAASAGTAGAGATAVVGADNTANVVATTPDDQLDAGKTPLVAGG